MINLNKRGENKKEERRGNMGISIVRQGTESRERISCKVEMNGHCEFVLGNNLFPPTTGNAINIII